MFATEYFRKPFETKSTFFCAGYCKSAYENGLKINFTCNSGVRTKRQKSLCTDLPVKQCKIYLLSSVFETKRRLPLFSHILDFILFNQNSLAYLENKKGWRCLRFLMQNAVWFWIAWTKKAGSTVVWIRSHHSLAKRKGHYATILKTKAYPIKMSVSPSLCFRVKFC